MRSPKNLHAKQARKYRWRRLQFLQLRSADLMTMAKPNLENHSDDSAAAGPHSSTSPYEPSGSRSIEENTDSGGLVYGHISMMEDKVTVAPPGWFAGEYYFFAVYDGHGGAKVAEKCDKLMHKCLARQMEMAKKLPQEERGFDWEKVMVDCFGNMDEEFKEDSVGRSEVAHGDDGAAEQQYSNMGSTAVLVLVGKAEIVVANCGDSRAVLCRGGVVIIVRVRTLLRTLPFQK